MSQQSYSPLIRRDDPTVPLYATLKPKLIMQAQQQAAAAAAAAAQIQNSSRNYNNYVQYSTIHRSQPAPITKPRSQFGGSNYQHVMGVGAVHQLPPPPPPPPAVPPVKPKRTFEYVMMGNHRGVGGDLHSDSGAFLLDDQATNTTPSINVR